MDHLAANLPALTVFGLIFLPVLAYAIAKGAAWGWYSQKRYYTSKIVDDLENGRGD